MINSCKQKSQDETDQEHHERVRQYVEPSIPDIVELRQELHGCSVKAAESQAQDTSRNEDDDKRDDRYQKLQAFPDYDAHQQAYDE